MPSKYTTIIAVRVKNDIKDQIERRLKDMTMNKWLNLAIADRLRSHKKRV